jgi:hypothetical protein
MGRHHARPRRTAAHGYDWRSTAVPESGFEPTALIAAEILFSLAQGDKPELLDDASAESLQTNFDAKYWATDNVPALSEPVGFVDWRPCAARFQRRFPNLHRPIETGGCYPFTIRTESDALDSIRMSS